MPPSDLELLTAWRDGDKRSGSALFERHFPALRRFFRNKVGAGSGHPGEDLIQKTFLACLEHVDEIRDPDRFRAYLFAIARRELIAFYRSRNRELDEEALMRSAVADLGPSPSQLVARKKEHRLLLAALRQVPLDFQIALELHYWEGLSTAELGEVLGLAQGTVKSRLRRGREILQEKMANLGGDALATTFDNLAAWAQGVREVVDADQD